MMEVNRSVIKVKCLISYIVICVGESVIHWLKSNIATTIYYFYLTEVRQNDVMRK